MGDPQQYVAAKDLSFTDGLSFESPDAKALSKLFDEIGEGTLYPIELLILLVKKHVTTLDGSWLELTSPAKTVAAHAYAAASIRAARFM